MNIAKIIEEDFADSLDGLAISVWFSGCDIRCPGCHNKHLWEPKDSEYTPKSLSEFVKKNYLESKDLGYEKSLSILGGEPLAPFNKKDLRDFIELIKDTGIYIRVWTGRTNDQLVKEVSIDPDFSFILSNINEIITGPFVEELKKDLPLRGSSNQEILIKDIDYKINGNSLTFVKDL